MRLCARAMTAAPASAIDTGALRARRHRGSATARARRRRRCRRGRRRRSRRRSETPRNRMPRTTASAAPELRPRMPGSAIGLRVRPWSTTPLRATAAPTTSPMTVRSTREATIAAVSASDRHPAQRVEHGGRVRAAGRRRAPRARDGDARRARARPRRRAAAAAAPAGPRPRECGRGRRATTSALAAAVSVERHVAGVPLSAGRSWAGTRRRRSGTDSGLGSDIDRADGVVGARDVLLLLQRRDLAEQRRCR